MNYIQFDPSKPLDIIPFGRIAIDFNPLDYNKPLEESETFRRYVGGSPANIAVGMAKLNKKAGFISCVSDDQFGRFVVNFFKARGIDTNHITVANHGQSLGLTFTEIKSPSESSILMYRESAADFYIEADHVKEDYVKSAKILLISGTSLSQSPSREAAFTAMEYAKKHGTVVVFDVDFRNYTWKNKNEIAVYYSLAAKHSDIILGSREEMTLLEGVIDPGNADDQRTAKRLHAWGNQIVVIKHGKQGSTAYAADGQSFHIKPFPVQALKGFGGGDAYASAFLYALLEGWELADALEFASASASMVISAHSCSEAMPAASEIHAFIKTQGENFNG